MAEPPSTHGSSCPLRRQTLESPDMTKRGRRTLQGAIGARGARCAARCELFWRTFPAGEASPSIASHARSLAARASLLYWFLCCASCVSLLGRCERGGRAERLQAPPARAGSTPRAARHPGMSRACRCPLGCRSQASRRRLVWCAASRRAVVALSWRGARASVPEARPRRCAPRPLGHTRARRVAADDDDRRRPPPLDDHRRRPVAPPTDRTTLPPTTIARRRRRRRSPTTAAAVIAVTQHPS